MNDPVMGIDLGTTNSEVALVQDGEVRVLDVTAGNKLFPSYVGIGEDGALLLGAAARNQYAVHPERTIKSIKRRMGSDDTVSLGGIEYSPQEISAMLLRQLKAIAEEHVGTPVARAVITVPAFFSDAQRQATREAGELAGLVVERIINEPTAAALAYESDRKQRKKILVYDLGGGTFDVSIVKMAEGVVEVLSSHGNNHLGGDDFDREIVTWCLTHLAENHGVDPQSSPQAMARITRAAENAKIALSTAPFATIEEEYLLEHRGNPVHLSLELSRTEFESMISGYIDDTLAAVHTAMEGAGLALKELDEVLLVGGATRTPMIAQTLEEVIGLQPRTEIDPELCVATGAALQGALIAGVSTATVLVDVTPYTFGTGTLGELNGQIYPFCFVPLIRKNTPIPVTKSDVFSTVQDHQEQVEVGVYQGEDPDALNNTEIGNFRVEGLRRVPAGNQVTLQFTLDLDGILQVTAREKDSALEKSITIDNAIGRFDDAQLDDARRRIDALFSDESSDDDAQRAPSAAGSPHNREHTQAQALIEKAERLLQDASSDDREDLVDNIESVKDAMQSASATGLSDAVDQLSDIVFYLEA